MLRTIPLGSAFALPHELLSPACFSGVDCAPLPHNAFRMRPVVFTRISKSAVFRNNLANGDGGAIYNLATSNLVLPSNTIFEGNTAPSVREWGPKARRYGRCSCPNRMMPIVLGRSRVPYKNIWSLHGKEVSKRLGRRRRR